MTKEQAEKELLNHRRKVRMSYDKEVAAMHAECAEALKHIATTDIGRAERHNAMVGFYAAEFARLAADEVNSCRALKAVDDGSGENGYLVVGPS